MTPRTADETILLVEDDRPIRRLLRRTLEHQGYRLLEASGGEQALGLASDHQGPIDLLLTDVVMPKMDGFTLGDRLAESRPQTRVLFLSGLAQESAWVRGGLKQSNRVFLLKPFTHDRLLQTIRDQLDTVSACAPSPRTDAVTSRTA